LLQEAGGSYVKAEEKSLTVPGKTERKGDNVRGHGGTLDSRPSWKKNPLNFSATRKREGRAPRGRKGLDADEHS